MNQISTKKGFNTVKKKKKKKANDLSQQLDDFDAGVGEVDGYDTEKVGRGIGGPDAAAGGQVPTNIRDRDLTKLESYQLKKGEKRVE